MKNLEKRKEVIKYSIKLNTMNLSPLRSGNISVKSIENSVEGFLITPSGKKYDTLKEEDIVFVSNDGNHDTNLKPSSEWKFHKDIYLKKIQIYPKKSKAMNLAFDVTPAKYVTGLITEKGISEASTEGLKKLFK